MERESQLRVLLVEDESVVALDIAHQLEGLGYAVVGPVDNGVDAIERATAEGPDLVLMDIRLNGEMDGIESADAITQSIDVPVIYVTAYSDRNSVERAKQSTPSGYILKPFQERELSIAIELAVYRHAAEQRLEEARRKAEMAARAKDDFLARVSHELRTPLNSILGMTSLAIERAVDAEQLQYLQIARSSAGVLNRLIGDILDFSKAASGDLGLVAETVPVSELVHDATKELLPAAREKGIALYLLVEAEADRVIRTDGGRLAQMLTALVGNAVKFTDAGEIRVAVGWSAESAERECLTISVSDTGPGVPAEEIDRLLEPFQQADSVLTRQNGGAGIGLTLVENVARLLGGRLTATSAMGEGSTFTVHLPCTTVRAPFTLERIGRCVRILSDSPWFRRIIGTYMRRLGCSVSADCGELVIVDGQNPGTDSVADAEASVVLDGPVTVSSMLEAFRGNVAAERSSIHGARALIVEDNRVNRMLARRLLESEGCSVSEAESGGKALEMLETGDFDFVLMDIEMPDLDGYETARRIRSGEHGDSRIPIFSVTGHEARQEAERVRQAGIDGQLSKPFHVEEIRELLSRVRKRDDVSPDEMSLFIGDARRALATADFARIAELCKTARVDLAGDARAAEIVFRIQLASRKEDGEQVGGLITALESLVAVPGKNV